MILALSHSVLARLFWFQRWWILRRLRHLEAKISSDGSPIHNEAQTSIEGHIYRTVIFILDHYSVLQKGSYQAVYHQIASAISLYPDYSKLVEQLAKLA